MESTQTLKSLETVEADRDGRGAAGGADSLGDDGHVGGVGPADDDHVIDELLVEEISIDGMCGVY